MYTTKESNAMSDLYFVQENHILILPTLEICHTKLIH